ncbi:BQ5605_C004g02799 [Microbotryum silenes-dioicae]|uniref:BQ5605_C004g02799 protein n=1 Tax=Microbotryum silenes-dioicae TaxID=796604 RepID=A0A2X0MC42_9BASI|nr:BQ5605_C004g02799 [Microbotryum silenes-dioicae]
MRRIKQLADFPGVGQNFQDHAFISPGYEIDNNIYNLVLNHNLGSLTNPVSDYIAWDRMSSNFFKEYPAAAAINNPVSDYIAWDRMSSNFFKEYPAAAAINDPEKEKLYQPLRKPPRLFYALLGALVAPLSRGQSNHPSWGQGRGDRNLQENPPNLQYPSFQGGRANDEEYYPGLNVSTDAQILQTIEASVQKVWRAVCTCATGSRSKGGILDPYLRVHGVNRLRVVDASAFPMLPPGHSQSVVYMLTERAADFIKETRGHTGVRIPAPQVTLPTGNFGAPYTSN